MWGGIRTRIHFHLERWIQRGVLFQLGLMAALVVVVACAGGLVAWAGTTQFARPGEAIWWAFLRLTDPGYLGDDEGTLLRVVSTTVTVLGYVIFMGSLIAILTQWLAHSMSRFESGLTPISMSNHLVVLGWTNRTMEIVRQVLGAQGRLRRFLADLDTSRLRIVILANDVGAERRLELREHLGPLWREHQIFLRTGSTLQPEHLDRLDLRRAAAIILPGSDFELGGSALTDARIVKTLLSIDARISDLPELERPDVVAEVLDPATVATARSVMASNLEIISSNRIVSRLLSQSVLHRGVARTLVDLLNHREGDSFYVRDHPHLAGFDPRDDPALFPQAVCLGAVRGRGAEQTIHIDPAAPLRLEPSDSLVFLAKCFDDCTPAPREPAPAPPPPPPPGEPPTPTPRTHRLLVVGWSHKVASLLEELDASRPDTFEVTLMSRMPLEPRGLALDRVEVDGARVRVEHVCGDYCVEKDLAAVAPERFDQVLFLATDAADSSEEADARTVLGYVLLRSMLREAEEPPEVIVELLDLENAHLFAGSSDTVVVSPRILSQLLAHVALRPALSSVFDELFGADGPEVGLRPAAEFGLDGRPVAFDEVQRVVRAAGRVALGVALRKGPERGVHLNPERGRTFTLRPEDRLMVLLPHRG